MSTLAPDWRRLLFGPDADERKSLKVVLLLVLVVLAVLYGAGHLSSITAPSLDDQYISRVIEHGVPVPPESRADAIRTGHRVVDQLSAIPNTTEVRVIIYDLSDRLTDAGVSGTETVHWVAVVIHQAVLVYKPSLMPLINQWIQETGPNLVSDEWFT